MYCVFHCCYEEGLPVPFPFGVCAVVPSSAPRFWRRPVCWDGPSSCPETRPGSTDLSAAGAAGGRRTRRQGQHFVSARSTLVFKSFTIAEANLFLPYRMYFNFISTLSECSHLRHFVCHFSALVVSLAVSRRCEISPCLVFGWFPVVGGDAQPIGSLHLEVTLTLCPSGSLEGQRLADSAPVSDKRPFI